MFAKHGSIALADADGCTATIYVRSGICVVGMVGVICGWEKKTASGGSMRAVIGNQKLSFELIF